MDIDEARDLLRRSIREREDAEEAVERGRATIESSRLIIRGLVRRYPELGSNVGDPADLWDHETEDGRPPGAAEAVRAALQDSPQEWFKVSELVAILRGRGRLPESENPANAIRTALERLVANDESDIYKGKSATSGAVIYCYDPDRERPSNAAAASGYGFDEEPF